LLAREAPLPASASDAGDFRALMEALAAAPVEAQVAVVGCRAPMFVPLFDFPAAARLRLVELADLAAAERLEASAASPADWVVGAVEAEGVSLAFRRQAVERALGDGLDREGALDAWRRLPD